MAVGAGSHPLNKKRFSELKSPFSMRGGFLNSEFAVAALSRSIGHPLNPMNYYNHPDSSGQNVVVWV